MKKVEYDRRKDMTKKAYRELQRANRVVNGMNTGTITMKTAKNPSRQENKKNLKKMLDRMDYQQYSSYRKRGKQYGLSSNTI